MRRRTPRKSGADQTAYSRNGIGAGQNRMKYCIKQDDKNRTNIFWELDGIDEDMIDWFWCNIEKCNFRKYSDMTFQWTSRWGIRRKGTPLNAVYRMEQDGFDGKRLQHLIRIETLDHVPSLLTEMIRYDHVVVLGGIGLSGDAAVCEDSPAFLWRMHQWQKTDYGAAGITTGYTKPGCRADSGKAWAVQTIKKLRDWELYLSDIYWKNCSREGVHAPHFSFRIDENNRYPAEDSESGR